MVIGIGALGLIIDQVSKAAMLSWLDPAHPVPLLGNVVTLQLLRNSGAAFSMGEGLTVGLTIISILALVGVLAWFVPKCATSAGRSAWACSWPASVAI